MNEMKDNSLPSPDTDALKNLVAEGLQMASKLGATEAEIGLSVSQGLSVSARMREVETIEHQQDNGLGISVYFGQRKGSASTSNLDSEAIRKTVEAACDIARYTSEDPCTGLASAELMATDIRQLDLYHPWNLSTQAAIDIALECEAAALDFDSRITNSEGSSIDIGSGVSVYGNSHGFLEAEKKSRHSISCSVVGEHQGAMQRDYWYDVNRSGDSLDSAVNIGQTAARRTVERLDAHKLSTRQSPVLFAPEMARSLISHYSSAMSGNAQYRKASFLLDALGQKVFPDFFQIVEEPYRKRGLNSANYDSEGVAVNLNPIVSDGVS